jgi:hypothetical protein
MSIKRGSIIGLAALLVGIATLFTVISCSTSNTKSTVKQTQPVVWINDLPGPSPWHRTIIVNNPTSYPIEASIKCSYGVSDKVTAAPNSTQKKVVYVVTPRSTKKQNMFDICELWSWKRM